ncbi:hypothetical protein BaRGS_00026418 [Batillaria attramentaria]|uniref:Uncharacterized protein n=1 Tax=Batillaria attramentaria TaxID=370345 RepID=A0ABD0K5S2_9CAEN
MYQASKNYRTTGSHTHGNSTHGLSRARPRTVGSYTRKPLYEFESLAYCRRLAPYKKSSRRDWIAKYTSSIGEVFEDGSAGGTGFTTAAVAVRTSTFIPK